MPDGAELLEVDEDDSAADVSIDDEDRLPFNLPPAPTTPKTFRERKKEKGCSSVIIYFYPFMCSPLQRM